MVLNANIPNQISLLMNIEKYRYVLRFEGLKTTLNAFFVFS